MKPASFSDMKKVQKMTLNQFNRWVECVYKSGMQDGLDTVYEETVAEIPEDDLRSILLSVKGIGEKRADEIMKKILSYEIEVQR